MTSPRMTIRTKIFLGCISLTLVTMLVGVLARRAQEQVSETALQMYDNAFTSMSYLRSAQTTTLGVSRDLAIGGKSDEARAVFIDQLQSVLDSLDVAGERAMSPRGSACATKLKIAVAELQARFKEPAHPPERHQFATLEQLFDMAVEIYSEDGLRLRHSVEERVLRMQRYTLAAVIASLVIACLITLMLSRAIVPSIRHAVGIATAIAGGRLNNTIDGRGSGETGLLLAALSTMQDSIAEKIACIETLLAEQASNHAAEIALQHARFEAALNNMTLGLCMFDAGGRLLVQNQRFKDLFASAGAGADGWAMLIDARLAHASSPAHAGERTRSFHRPLGDGRTIAVSEEAMDDGGCVVTYEDVTERLRADHHLWQIARHDALTGLPNRLLFREHLEQALASLAGSSLLSVLCLDLDRFKMVNDTLGHPVGDTLLKETAIRLEQAVGPDDIVVRLGGDEFAIVTCDASHGDAARLLAERLIAIVSQPFHIDGHHITVGASIGIADTSQGLDTPDDLLKNADVALYKAKSDGRGLCRCFAREMNDRVQAKRQLELDLRAAMTEHRFELHYQPLVSVQSGAVVALEALLRWRHPERGLVSPADFIPLAEEMGLIVELGRWVLNQACLDARAWPDDVKVAVNLSPLQFRSLDLIGDVVDALRLSGLPATRLEVEITESTMLRDTKEILTILHHLRELGICISMDDFGTGYSSLSYLRQFPFDKIKIDRSFIRNMGKGGDDLAIVRAMIGLGRSLRMNVVAEGIEAADQRELLREAGCHEMQGYLFGKPREASAVPEIIERYRLRQVA